MMKHSTSILGRARLTARLAVMVPLSVLLLASCEHSGPTGPRPLAIITVTPNPNTMAVGATQQFVATARTSMVMSFQYRRRPLGP